MKYFSTLFSCFLFLVFTHCQPSAPPEKSLQEIADELNKKCPQMVDSETRLDGIQIKDGNKTIVYKYTLINLSAEQVDTLAFRKALWPGILSLIKTSPAMKTLRDQETRFEYYYQDKQSQLIYNFKVAPADYKP